ncbi:Uncharacterized protein YeaC [Salmonella bongori]|nr:Uncharacterized protein YeaC [Salmonella bongori]
MNLDEIINSMTPEIYQRLATAVGGGKMAGWCAADAGTKRKLSATGDVVAGAAQYGSAAYDHRYSRSDGDEKQAAAQSGFRHYSPADCDIKNAAIIGRPDNRIRCSHHPALLSPMRCAYRACSLLSGTGPPYFYQLTLNVQRVRQLCR